MKNLLLLMAAIAIASSGCSMCCGPFDYDYPTFGGKHMRADRSHGRVGSILSDPMTGLSGPSSDSNLVAPPDPIDTDGNETLDFEDSEDSENGLRMQDADDELERIEPLGNGGSLPSPDSDPADDSTASLRWRPRPLR